MHTGERWLSGGPYQKMVNINMKRCAAVSLTAWTTPWSCWRRRKRRWGGRRCSRCPPSRTSPWSHSPGRRWSCRPLEQNRHTPLKHRTYTTKIHRIHTTETQHKHTFTTQNRVHRQQGHNRHTTKKAHADTAAKNSTYITDWNTAFLYMYTTKRSIHTDEAQHIHHWSKTHMYPTFQTSTAFQRTLLSHAAQIGSTCTYMYIHVFYVRAYISCHEPEHTW